MDNYILNASILSSLVYNDPNTIKIYDLSLLLIINNTKTDTHGVIMIDKNNKKLYICFRGTADEKNAITDLECIQRKVTIGGKQVMIHDGFLKSFESIQDEIKLFAFNEYKEYDIVVCGHSLGGALAYICVSYLNIPNDIYVVTCGAPRVGDTKFSDLFFSKVIKSYRFIYCDDVVPEIPRINYVQVPIEIRLDKNGNQIKYYNIWKRFISWIKKIKNISFKFYIIEDHSMVNYINVITIWTRNQ